MPEWRFSLPNGETHVQDELVFRQDPLFTGMVVQDSYLSPLRTVEVSFAGTPSYETMARLRFRLAEAIPAAPPPPPVPNLNLDAFLPSSMSWVDSLPSLARGTRILDPLPFHLTSPATPRGSLDTFLEGVRAIFDKGELVLPRSQSRFEKMLVENELNPTVRALRDGPTPNEWARLPLEISQWEEPPVHHRWASEFLPVHRQWASEFQGGFLEAEHVTLPPIEEMPLGPDADLGRIPLRTELTVLPADEPRRPLGFTMRVRESLGIAAINPRGLMRMDLSSEPEAPALPPVEEAPAELPMWPSRFDRL